MGPLWASNNSVVKHLVWNILLRNDEIEWAMLIT